LSQYILISLSYSIQHRENQESGPRLAFEWVDHSKEHSCCHRNGHSKDELRKSTHSTDL